jgi:hypothetical protein
VRSTLDIDGAEVIPKYLSRAFRAQRKVQMEELMSERWFGNDNVSDRQVPTLLPRGHERAGNACW